MRVELLEHQVTGIEYLRGRPHALLADEPGLGKTVQLLRSATEPVLAVAPAMVLESGTWSDEITKWEPDLDITTVPYTKLCVRGPNGKVERDYNGVPIVEVRPEYQRRWGTVICDESHYLKGRKTSWTAGVHKLDYDELRLATGTPIPNWAHEAFTALQLVRPEEARTGGQFGSYWRWAKEWFHVGATTWSPMAVGDLRTSEHIENCRECRGKPETATPRTWEEFDRVNWDGRMLRRLRKDCLDLPPLIGPTVWHTGMTRAQKRFYRELERDYTAWLDGDQEKAVTAWSTPGQLVKLMKCATGLESIDPSVQQSGKLDVLRTILSDRPLPTLVVAHFRSSVDACARAAVQVGKKALVVRGGVRPEDRIKAIRAFQTGAIDVLCASVESIAEGMTLHQGGADQVIRVERSARPSYNEQVIRRLHRLGVTRPIVAIDLVAEGTADEALLGLLERKTDQQMQALAPSELRSLVA